MLILTRKTGEAVRIGNVRIVINRVGRGAVRIGIDAPLEVPIVGEKLDEDSGIGEASDSASKRDPGPVNPKPAAPPTGSTSGPHRTAGSRCGWPAGSGRNTSKRAAGVDRFQPLHRARRRGPDSRSMARLNPGFHC